VAIYDWASKRVLCSSPVDPDKVMDACWKDETEFATVGLKHVKFFNIQGLNITMSKGLYGPSGVTPMISCAYAFKEQVFLTGMATGELVMWNGRSIGKTFKQHADALWQIINVENKSMIMTGGNDGKVILWDRTFTPKQSIDIAPMSKFPAGIRSLDYLDSAKTLLVGTRGAEIIEVNAATGTKLKTHVYGHFSGVAKAELWGCAVHPKEQTFATCGADKTIRLWKDNQMIMASDQFANDLTAVDWSSNGQFLIAGDFTGFIHLIDPKTLKSLGSSPSQLANKPNAWIEDLKISPDSQIVAFGTHGGLSSIDLVKIIDGKQL
jgi:WD40 repeat protein